MVRLTHLRRCFGRCWLQDGSFRMMLGRFQHGPLYSFLFSFVRAASWHAKCRQDGVQDCQDEPICCQDGAVLANLGAKMAVLVASWEQSNQSRF